MRIVAYRKKGDWGEDKDGEIRIQKSDRCERVEIEFMGGIYKSKVISGEEMGDLWGLVREIEGVEVMEGE